MARSPFTFSAPFRRRQKPTPAPPPAAPEPVSKAHRILGTCEASTGSRFPQARDITSASEISVTASERTLTEADSSRHEGAKTDRAENEPAAAAAGRRPGEDEELGPVRRVPYRRTSSDMLGKTGRTNASGAHSLRRTSSSIDCDISRMPLETPPQTSSSAIPKGLPSKASALLDLDGPVVRTTDGKKKQTRLDLSNFLSSYRSKARDSTPTREMATSPPSAVSAVSSPALPQRTPSKRSGLAGVAEQPPTVANKASGLHDLYEHYEQATFRDVMGDAGSHADPPSETKDDSDVPILERDEWTRCDHQTSRGNGLSVAPQASGNQTHTDSSASISSRRTRTSKASSTRRANQSLSDYDLQEKSILSLSDDSDVELQSENAPAVTSKGDLGEVRARPSSSRTPSAKARHSSASSMSLELAMRRSFLLSSSVHAPPPSSSLPEPPPRNNRTSGAPSSAGSLPSRTSSVRSVSHVSVATSISSVSSNTRAAHSPRSVTYGAAPTATRVATAVPPPRSGSPQSRSKSQSPPGRLTQVSAPSVAPAALEGSALPLPPAPLDLRLGGASHVSFGSQRYMAVTHQEEMLLAALRSKRATLSIDRSAVPDDGEAHGVSKLPYAYSNHKYHGSVAGAAPTRRPHTLPPPASQLSPSPAHHVPIAGQSANAPGSDHRNRPSSLVGPPAAPLPSPSRTDSGLATAAGANTITRTGSHRRQQQQQQQQPSAAASLAQRQRIQQQLLRPQHYATAQQRRREPHLSLPPRLPPLPQPPTRGPPPPQSTQQLAAPLPTSSAHAVKLQLRLQSYRLSQGPAPGEEGLPTGSAADAVAGGDDPYAAEPSPDLSDLVDDVDYPPYDLNGNDRRSLASTATTSTTTAGNDVATTTAMTAPSITITATASSGASEATDDGRHASTSSSRISPRTSLAQTQQRQGEEGGDEKQEQAATYVNTEEDDDDYYYDDDDDDDDNDYRGDEEGHGLPRPDSPISPADGPRSNAVRLSAVGVVGYDHSGAAWW